MVALAKWVPVCGFVLSIVFLLFDTHLVIHKPLNLVVILVLCGQIGICFFCLTIILVNSMVQRIYRTMADLARH